MAQIQLDDRLFEVAQRRAKDSGFATVDEYIADFVMQDIEEDAENLDHLFTPERLAELDRISTEIKAGGKTYTLAEADEYLRNKQQQWLADHAR